MSRYTCESRVDIRMSNVQVYLLKSSNSCCCAAYANDSADWAVSVLNVYVGSLQLNYE